MLDAQAKITERTRAIIPVHFGGQPCDLAELQKFADIYKLHIVEDAAHALPATYRGKRIGTISELTAFSFYATKTLSTGEGGMVTTGNESYARRLQVMRLHGISRDAWKRYSTEGSWSYEVIDAGYKYNLTDLQSALGIVQLSKSDAMDEDRRRIAERYTRELDSIGALQTPEILSDRTTSWHLYVLRLHLEELRIDRGAFICELADRGVSASVHFTPLHLQPFYQRTFNYKEGDFPVAEREYRRCLSLPIYPTMTDEEVEHVIWAVKDVVGCWDK